MAWKMLDSFGKAPQNKIKQVMVWWWPFVDVFCFLTFLACFRFFGVLLGYVGGQRPGQQPVYTDAFQVPGGLVCA